MKTISFILTFTGAFTFTALVILHGNLIDIAGSF